jgi:hypothetical protein
MIPILSRCHQASHTGKLILKGGLFAKAHVFSCFTDDFRLRTAFTEFEAIFQPGRQVECSRVGA